MGVEPSWLAVFEILERPAGPGLGGLVHPLLGDALLPGLGLAVLADRSKHGDADDAGGAATLPPPGAPAAAFLGAGDDRADSSAGPIAVLSAPSLIRSSSPFLSLSLSLLLSRSLGSRSFLPTDSSTYSRYASLKRHERWCSAVPGHILQSNNLREILRVVPLACTSPCRTAPLNASQVSPPA